ncbi:MAG: hypothetical protein ACOZNI_12295 [Myxococcota bacterium]
MDCAPGHEPPAWTAPGPVAERCVVAPEAVPGRGWFLCGGLPLRPGERVAIPTTCPDAPGGLAVGVRSAGLEDFRAMDRELRVNLDCPGRYEVWLRDDRVVVALAGAGASCVGASPPGLDVTGRALYPVRDMLPAGVAALLPARVTHAADVDTWRDGETEAFSGVLTWEGGRLPVRADGLDVAIGTDADVQGLWVGGSAEGITLRDVPVHIGAALPVDTWAHLRLTRAGWHLDHVLPARLPEARKLCGVEVPVGTRVWISTRATPLPPVELFTEEPLSSDPCASRTGPPSDVHAGATWTSLTWDVGVAECRVSCEKR